MLLLWPLLWGCSCVFGASRSRVPKSAVRIGTEVLEILSIRGVVLRVCELVVAGWSCCNQSITTILLFLLLLLELGGGGQPQHRKVTPGGLVEAGLGVHRSWWWLISCSIGSSGTAAGRSSGSSGWSVTTTTTAAATGVAGVVEHSPGADHCKRPEFTRMDGQVQECELHRWRREIK